MNHHDLSASELWDVLVAAGARVYRVVKPKELENALTLELGSLHHLIKLPDGQCSVDRTGNFFRTPLDPIP